MSDFFDTLALDAKDTIKGGYYELFKPTPSIHLSLRKAIRGCNKNPVITEIKAASPSIGTIRENINPTEIARAMENGGAVGISVLTEPKHFNGSLDTLSEIRSAVKLPILMKDIILNCTQIVAASYIGADAVLLIKALFDRDYGETDLDTMISFIHAKGLEVLLEVHTEKEFCSAALTNADVIGINNRNLADLKLNLNTTKTILQKNKLNDLVVVSESGIKTPSDLQFLSDCGASAFLIGSSIMLTENIEEKVREFVNA